MRGLEPLIFEVSSPGRKAYSLPDLEVPDTCVCNFLPEGEIRKDARSFQKWPRSIWFATLPG